MKPGICLQLLRGYLPIKEKVYFPQVSFLKGED